ncbi:MAG: hypothetical protein JO066_10570 [Verrucomicrobia bacterium]|nr:hypothetical protein [Verrucomicrobiota bacterium]
MPRTFAPIHLIHAYDEIGRSQVYLNELVQLAELTGTRVERLRICALGMRARLVRTEVNDEV